MASRKRKPGTATAAAPAKTSEPAGPELGGSATETVEPAQASSDAGDEAARELDISDEHPPEPELSREAEALADLGAVLSEDAEGDEDADTIAAILAAAGEVDEAGLDQAAAEALHADGATEQGPSEGMVSEGDGSSEEAVEDTTGFLKGLLEAVLFVSDHPLEVKDLARAARIDKKRAGELVAELVTETRSRGIRIEEVAGGFIFRTNPAYSAYVRHFLQQRPVRLSRAQIETLSIVAYRQPITRPEIDDIRGVDSGPVLKGLLDRDLIRIIGKKDEPGRPMLYGTTNVFLEAFSLKSLRDLPTLREYTELTDESRQSFEAETGERAPEGDVSAEFQAEAAPASEGSEASSDDANPPESRVEASMAADSEDPESLASEGSAADEVAASAAAAADRDDKDDDDADEDDDDDDDDDDDEEPKSDEAPAKKAPAKAPAKKAPAKKPPADKPPAEKRRR